MDLVVSVDTSIVHLAGAMGVRTWALLPFSPDFRWLLEREDSPWYPNVRLFRQPRLDDWDSVLARIQQELRSIGSAALPTAASIQDALALHQQGRLAEAEPLYAAVVRHHPRHFDAFHLYGVLKHQQGHSLEALPLISAALELDPGSTDALSNYWR